MWYFAYGIDLHHRSVIAMCRERSLPTPRLVDPRAAVLRNHRMCFPMYDTRWAGGVADLAEAFGKSIPGAVFEITADDLDLLAQLHERRKDEFGREIGTRKLVEVRAETLEGAVPVEAVTFRRVRPEYRHVPPSRDYVERLIASAVDLGLGTMWVMYLRSLIPTDPPGTRNTITPQTRQQQQSLPDLGAA